MSRISKKVLRLFRLYGFKVYTHMENYRKTHHNPSFELALDNYKYYIFLRDIIKTRRLTEFCL
jgi:hypothetical protein